VREKQLGEASTDGYVRALGKPANDASCTRLLTATQLPHQPLHRRILHHSLQPPPTLLAAKQPLSLTLATVPLCFPAISRQLTYAPETRGQSLTNPAPQRSRQPPVTSTILSVEDA
jgi:hypothetical protein